MKRFLEAQAKDFDRALNEIKNGKKVSHWMWYIFPQIAGLGHSSTANFYAIKDVDEASEFLHHPILGERLRQISNELLKLKTKDAHQVFGSPDDMKLRSSMTLFAEVPNTDPVFEKVLEKFFSGEKDQKTLNKLK